MCENFTTHVINLSYFPLYTWAIKNSTYSILHYESVNFTQIGPVISNYLLAQHHLWKEKGVFCCTWIANMPYKAVKRFQAPWEEEFLKLKRYLSLLTHGDIFPNQVKFIFIIVYCWSLWITLDHCEWPPRSYVLSNYKKLNLTNLSKKEKIF